MQFFSMLSLPLLKKKYAMRHKIHTENSLIPILEKARQAGKIIVFTNGCFDLFHYGHLISLTHAKHLGDLLVVGINSDISVKKLKGPKRPFVPEDQRIAMVAAIEYVDYCLLFSAETPEKLIEKIKPDILAKGEEYRGQPIVGEEIVHSRGGKVVFLPMVPGISTSILAKKRESVL
jgi:rfaE bifunctional protein nucleotidyltransferase chain/domain